MNSNFSFVYELNGSKVSIYIRMSQKQPVDSTEQVTTDNNFTNTVRKEKLHKAFQLQVE